jgi:polyhydroxyalkanoate synthesis regulator phasin
MKTPLQVIADFGCPTNSAVDAIRHLSEREDLTHDQYRKGIQEMIGLTDPPETESYHYAMVLFKYIIQETIRAHNTGGIPDMDDMLDVCIKKTYKHLEEHPWSVTMFNIKHGLQEREEIDLETGVITSTKPKGAKKDVTERIFNELKSKGASRQDIIDAFVEETGMSKAGATTYFHTLKKELGFKESTTEKKSSKSESKQELAERLYQESPDKSKPVMITLFTEKLETSKLGAQTYYYACKKKFAPLTQ